MFIENKKLAQYLDFECLKFCCIFKVIDHRLDYLYPPSLSLLLVLPFISSNIFLIINV